MPAVQRELGQAIISTNAARPQSTKPAATVAAARSLASWAAVARDESARTANKREQRAAFGAGRIVFDIAAARIDNRLHASPSRIIGIVSDSGTWVVIAGNAVLIIAGADTPAAEPKVLDLIAASPFGRMVRKARVSNPFAART